MKTKNKIFLLSTIPFLSFAEIDPFDLSLEDILSVKIEVATMKADNERDIPASVSVMTEREWSRIGATRGSDVIDRMPGMITSPFFGTNMAGFRGFSLTANYRKSAYVLDGVTLNGFINSSAQGMSSDILDLFLLEKIEVARGPISNIYGSSAMLGAISMKTWSSKKDIVEAKVSLGNFGYDHVGARSSYGFGDNYRITFVATQRDFDDYNVDRLYLNSSDVVSKGVTRRAWNRKAILTKVEKNNFSFEYLYQEYTFDDWANFETNLLFDSRVVALEPQKFHFIKLEDSYSANDLKIKPTLSYLQGSRFFMNNLVGEGYPDEDDTSISYNKARENKLGAKLHISSEKSDFLKWFLATEFTHYHVKLRQGALGPIGTNPTSIAGEGRIRDRLSLMGNSDFAFFNGKLHFHIGGRWDRYSDANNRFSPRLAAIYHSSQSLTHKFIYSNAYRVAGLSNKVGSSSLNVQPSPDVKPEEMNLFELVTMYKKGRTRSILSIFTNEIKDEIQTVRVSLSEPGPRATNVRDGRASGVEFEIKSGLKGWIYDFSSTYMFSIDSAVFPKFMSKWSIGKELDNWFFSLRGRHLFSYYSGQELGSDLNEFDVKKMSRYFDLGIHIDYSFKKFGINHNLAFDISNALDRNNIMPANGTQHFGLRTPGLGAFGTYKINF